MKLERVRERFRFNYESSASASYLIIQVGEQEKVQQFQIEMITNNPIQGVLPLNMRQKDGTIHLYYNITSKIPLSQYLSRKKLARNEVIEILAGMTSLLLECKNYLLSDKCFLFEEEYIFIKPGTTEIAMVYIPIADESNTLQDFKDFIIKFAVYSANIDETGSDNFLQRILGSVKMEQFNIVEFDRLLKELKNNKEPQIRSEASRASGSTPSGVSQPEEEMVKHTLEPVKQEVDRPQVRIPGKANESIPPALPQKPGKPVKASEDSTADGSSVTQMRYKSSSILIGALSQVGILILVILSSGFFEGG